MNLPRRAALLVVIAALLLVSASACKQDEPTTVPIEENGIESDATTASDEFAPTDEEIAEAEGVQDIFSNGDDTAVTAGAEGPTFPLVEPMKVTAIVTLHVGEVAPAGTIALKDANEKTWGPWPATPDAAPDGNTYWLSEPNEVLPVGEYMVVDSDPDTWAKNDGSDGFGFVTVKGTLE